MTTPFHDARSQKKRRTSTTCPPPSSSSSSSSSSPRFSVPEARTNGTTNAESAPVVPRRGASAHHSRAESQKVTRNDTSKIRRGENDSHPLDGNRALGEKMRLSQLSPPIHGVETQEDAEKKGVDMPPPPPPPPPSKDSSFLQRETQVDENVENALKVLKKHAPYLLRNSSRRWDFLFATSEDYDSSRLLEEHWEDEISTVGSETV